MNTKRFCQVCEKVTTFQYNKNIGHSYCQFCGSRFAIATNSEEALIIQLNNQKKEIAKLKNQVVSYKALAQSYKDKYLNIKEKQF